MRTWVSKIPPEWIAVAFLAVLALAAGALIGALVLIARSARSLDTNMRRLHLQQSTIVGMMLKAGFRPLKTGKDWFDDGDVTGVAGNLEWTKINLEKPGPF